MTVTIANATSNPILTTSGKSINAYGGVTVDDTASLTTAETVTITLSQSESNNPGNNFSFYPTATSLGTITDPNGGGSFNLSTETFTETGLVGGDPNFATALLSRLVYNAPTLPAGQGLGSQAQITVTDNSSGTPTASTTFSDPVIVGVLSPPLISGTAANEPVASGDPIPPFATLTLTNTNCRTTITYTLPRQGACIRRTTPYQAIVMTPRILLQLSSRTVGIPLTLTVF